MKLKDFQIDVLDQLSFYLTTLDEQRGEAEDFVEFQQRKGKEAAIGDYCLATWEALQDRLPKARKRDGKETIPVYVPRTDGMKRPIPNVCLKVPTGGGKTLLAANAVERINAEYFKKQTGLVLWVVPSNAIYTQTWNALANREHPYRQLLERASGGRVKMLEKGDRFTAQDIDSQLCVMVLMLQSGVIKKSSKEMRKMFQDSGKYPSFFPDVDDATANGELLQRVPNLETNAADGTGLAQGWLMAKQSLANVFRLCRPLVVIDEGHKAYSEKALDFIASHNPRYILELSATPNAKHHISNVVVNVTGTDLKNEEMIKLPINVVNEGGADWKHALSASCERRDALEKTAEKVRHNEGRYIRPILLIRVERTGKDQRDKQEVHSEDVREYLIEKLGVDEDEIKVKSAELDELEAVDKEPLYKGKGLISDLCPVRYIITKDALREGWDCPFAYVLAVLSRTTSGTALTQMIGRVLRQPGAKLTSEAALNESYVFTHDQDVQEAVENVRKGLQEEGMGDLADSVRAVGPGVASTLDKVTLKRRQAFKGTRVFMPRVLSRHYKTNDWRNFEYERDLLGRLDWDKLHYTERDSFVPDEKEQIERTQVRVDVDSLDLKDGELGDVTVTGEEIGQDLDVAALVRLLLDVVPNPWQGERIVQETLDALRSKGYSESRLVANRLYLLKAIKEDLREQINQQSETVFRQMLADGDLSFQLMSSGDATLNWELAETLDVYVSDEDKVLVRKNGTPLEKSFLEPVYQKQINLLEKDVAWYLDSHKAVTWWHRIAVKQDWHVQGWQRGRIYPDFLVSVHSDGGTTAQFTVLETKGMHLKGNEDTEYKQKLFDLLTEYSKDAQPVGEVLLKGEQQHIRFDMLLENDWKQKLQGSLPA